MAREVNFAKEIRKMDGEDAATKLRQEDYIELGHGRRLDLGSCVELE